MCSSMGWGQWALECIWPRKPILGQPLFGEANAKEGALAKSKVNKKNNCSWLGLSIVKTQVRTWRTATLCKVRYITRLPLPAPRNYGTITGQWFDILSRACWLCCCHKLNRYLSCIRFWKFLVSKVTAYFSSNFSISSTSPNLRPLPNTFDALTEFWDLNYLFHEFWKWS